MARAWTKVLVPDWVMALAWSWTKVGPWPGTRVQDRAWPRGLVWPQAKPRLANKKKMAKVCHGWPWLGKAGQLAGFGECVHVWQNLTRQRAEPHVQ